MLLSLYVMDSPFLGVPERGETYDAPACCSGLFGLNLAGSREAVVPSG
jgi:hypothetical protein